MPYFLPLNPTNHLPGHALLVRVDSSTHTGSWWVTVNQPTATSWAIPRRAHTLLGTITRTGDGWAVTATAGRVDLRRGLPPTVQLPAAATPPQAVHLLLAYWQSLDRRPRDLTRRDEAYRLLDPEPRRTLDIVLGIYALLD
jgi:hypothetical protein